MWNPKCVYFLKKYIKYVTILKIASFIFPNMIKNKFIIYFYNVAKMVIIHRKITTFGYKKVVCLENCSIFQYYGYL